MTGASVFSFWLLLFALIGAVVVVVGLKRYARMMAISIIGFLGFAIIIPHMVITEYSTRHSGVEGYHGSEGLILGYTIIGALFLFGVGYFWLLREKENKQEKL